METDVCFPFKVIHTPQKYCMSMHQCGWRNYVAVDIAEGMDEAYWKIRGHLTLCWLNTELKDNEVAVIITLPCC